MKKVMKALNIMALVLAVMNINGLGVFADSFPAAMNMSASVLPVFNIAVQNGGNLTMGNLSAGQSAFTSVGLNVTTNHGMSWQLLVKADPLLRTGGTETIGGNAFQYNITGTGLGTYNPAGGALVNMPATNATAYTAAASEYSVTSLPLILGVQLNMPQNTIAGSYTTTINATLVDAF